ncbi:MAG: hypothetical protein HN952_03300 [Candidatus Cloacimonetes bacterium]|jgi:hypothetical protein|nr:hypothetical protein [Candidatus Cloacimonadota bacterium]MBT6993963.1 hypothetical protein [Candidatus Cloacimonadota bacterium]MBT7469761.1 hypothetical protein [Candidatus Cloacimonadota bacterium]
MKKTFLLIILICLTTNLLYSELSFSGLNEFQYIRSDRFNETNNYFSDKFQLQLHYNNFLAGVKYDYYKPKFDKFATSLEENENYFDEYYLQFESDHWFAQVGTFEAVIGSGIVLHNFYDNDFDLNSRLIGGYLNPVYDKWQLQLFGGLMECDNPNPDFDDEYDQVGAFDADFNIIANLTIGGSYVLHRELIDADEDDFNNRIIYAGKFNYSSSLFDLMAEYATSKDDLDENGTAIYSNITTYLDKFTLTSTYKNYENFDVRISDLPMVNHSGQQLEHSWDAGKDEEGVMGEIRFLPNYENEFVINYAEGWNSNYKVRLSNLYTEFKHDFEDWSFKVENEILEQFNENSNHWYKEITPTLTFDFLIKDNPVLVKAEYQYKEEDKVTDSHSHLEPRLQTDISIGNYSLSVAVENQIGESEDGDDSEFWIGGELATTIFNNTDVRLFYGKEKGGVVCRNGVCKNQAAFDGMRLTVSTRF